jgi:hypothetical protein
LKEKMNNINQLIIEGCFTVESASPKGTYFQNLSDQSVRVKFSAAGQWTYNPNVGFHSAAGHPNYPKGTENYKLPGFPEGSLIVRRANGSFQYIGTVSTIELNPMEVVSFVCNDDGTWGEVGGHGDNQGCISILWALQMQDEYAQLRDFLAAGKWQEADEETARLMLKSIGRDFESSFERDELSKIPCSLLSSLDKMWLFASQGRFGFSVQKGIWESVGGSPQTEDTAIAEGFGDRIGQYANGNWVYYDDLTFNLSAPTGHLPALWWRRNWVNAGFAYPIASLVQRLITCKIS